MRRKDREIKDMAEILEIVMAQTVCTIAIQDEPCPCLVPMNYGAQMEDGRLILYFHGAKEGRKMELLKKGPQPASFSILGEHQVHVNKENPGKSSASFESVCGWGQAELVYGEERKRGLAVLMNHIGRPVGETFTAEELTGPSCDAAQVWKIVAAEITGKRHE